MAEKHLSLIVSIQILLVMSLGCGSSNMMAPPPPKPQSEFLYAQTVQLPSLTSQLLAFKLDPSTGVLSSSATMTVPFTLGIAADPASKFLYLSDGNFVAPAIDIFSIDQNTGSLTADGALLLTSICALCPPPSGREMDPFTFLASKSLRGETSCGEYGCRVEKLDMLGRYAALYANQIILPLPLTDPSTVDGPEEASQEVSQAALVLLRLRPLFDAGILYPVIRRSFHCRHTLRWCQDMQAIVDEASFDMMKAFKNDFLVRFQLPEKAPTRIPSIYVEGPEDFLEHGSIVMLFNEPDGWRAKNWKFDSEGIVELRGDRKYAALFRIFIGIAEDTSFYLAYGRNRNARLLTNLPGETFLLDALTRDDEVSASSEALNDCMTHSLPLLTDLPISRLLAIRREERDSFERYRLAVRQILMEVSQGVSGSSIRRFASSFENVSNPSSRG